VLYKAATQTDTAQDAGVFAVYTLHLNPTGPFTRLSHPRNPTAGAAFDRFEMHNFKELSPAQIADCEQFPSAASALSLPRGFKPIHPLALRFYKDVYIDRAGSARYRDNVDSGADAAETSAVEFTLVP
jgi:hypothetical protein